MVLILYVGAQMQADVHPEAKSLQFLVRDQVGALEKSLHVFTVCDLVSYKLMLSS